MVAYQSSHTGPEIDAAVGGMTVDNYVTADIASGVLNIDISGCDIVDIVVNAITLASSQAPYMRFSTDGGTTLETGAVYATIYHAGSTTQYLDETKIGFAPEVSTNTFRGTARIVGHAKAKNTVFDVSASLKPNINTIVDYRGFVDTLDQYDTLQFFGWSSVALSTVDITVFKY